MDAEQFRRNEKIRLFNKSLPLSLKYNLERLSLEACRRLMIRPLFSQRQSINVVTENTTVNWSQQMQYLETMCQPQSIDTAIIYWPCISIELKNWMIKIISSIIIHLLHTACIKIISFYILQVILDYHKHNDVPWSKTNIRGKSAQLNLSLFWSTFVNLGHFWSTLIYLGQSWSALVNLGKSWSALVN